MIRKSSMRNNNVLYVRQKKQKRMDFNFNPQGRRRSFKAKSAIKRMTQLFTMLGLAALTLMCCIMIYYQMSKYIEALTTVAIKADASNDKLGLPSITLCPGYKRDLVSELVWPIRMYDYTLYDTNDTFADTFPTTREGADALWNEYTYKAEEIFLSIGATFQNIKYGDGDAMPNKPLELLNREDGCVSLVQHDGLLGKCYTINTLCEVAAVDEYLITFNMSGIPGSVMSLMLHHPKGYLGINGPRPGPVIADRRVEKEIVSSISLFTKHKRNHNGHKNVNEDEYYECVNKVTRDRAKELTPFLCYHPSFKNILGNELASKLESCKTEADFFAAKFMVINAAMKLANGSNCEMPAIMTTYEVTRTDYLQHLFTKPDMAIMFVTLGNTDIIIEEEYNLQDFAAVIATLGGSVGIFLGWSLFDLIKSVSYGLERVLKRRLG